MSDCMLGGRLAYARPGARGRGPKGPIRGRIAFDDGTERALSMARYVNGAERRVVSVEVDGVAYVPSRGTVPGPGGEAGWMGAETRRDPDVMRGGPAFAVANASGDMPPCVCPNRGKAVKR